MKLDKRACRHAANAPLNISLNAGVLYTDRVKYLVTALSLIHISEPTRP